jgi:chromate transporter
MTAAKGKYLTALKDVFVTSLRLGLTSFGGPLAHLGYFESLYVKKRRWLDHEDYSHMVALCQLLPGPTSSQVNFLIGFRHAGWAGALLSWVGFTLPSALLMYAFAVALPATETPAMEAVLHGLKLVAVAVVAQAVWSMASRLCPDKPRVAIGLAAMAILLLRGGALAQFAVIIFGAGAGWVLCRDIRQQPGSQKALAGKTGAWVTLALFFILLAVLPALAAAFPGGVVPLIEKIYRSGAVVFGGGHVVLPLLRDATVPHFMGDDAFLSGYGFAQAMPGPLFSLAAYLGAAAAPPGLSALWSFAALLALFLPGMLAALAGVRFWQWMSRRPAAQGALAGINAAVVGILGAALYNPVWQTAILAKSDVVVATVSFFLLEKWKLPPLVIVVFCVAAALGASLL